MTPNSLTLFVQGLRRELHEDVGLLPVATDRPKCPRCGGLLECFRGRNSSRVATKAALSKARVEAETAGKTMPDSLPEVSVFIVVHARGGDCTLRFDSLGTGFSEDEAWETFKENYPQINENDSREHRLPPDLPQAQPREAEAIQPELPSGLETLPADGDSVGRDVEAPMCEVNGNIWLSHSFNRTQTCERCGYRISTI